MKVAGRSGASEVGCDGMGIKKRTRRGGYLIEFDADIQEGGMNLYLRVKGKSFDA